MIISGTNLKTLVIPDIHNRTRWIESFLAKYKKKYGYDQVVFLGDYFDMFNDGPFEVIGTAHWLKESLKYPDRIHLIGNHDMPYMCPRNASVWCPGWTQEKSNGVNSVMTQEDWDKLIPAYHCQGWLLSHAGACDWIFNHPILGVSVDGIIEQCNKALKDVKNGSYRMEFGSGFRMSNVLQLLGGITWLDWDNEFIPMEGINQIVGHTPYRVPQSRIHKGLKSENWCLDTHSQHIGVLENGVFTTTQCHGVIHTKRGHVVAEHKNSKL